MSIRVAGHTATFSFWNTYRMDEIYTERKEPGEVGLPVLSVSIHTGVSDGELDEEELGKKVKRIADKTQYRKAMADDLVFNMMRAWQGAIGVVKTSGMVSPAYIVAKPNDKVYPLFMDYYMKMPKMVETIHRQSYGVTDFRLRLYWDSFAPIRCTLPPIEEQRRIAEILATQDRVIELYDQKIEQLKRFKKGMLSKLFPKPGHNTPEIRFTGFTEPWKRCRLSDLYNYACSGGTPSSNIEDYYNGSIPFLGISDIASRVIMNTKKYISEEGLNNSSATIIPAGAITLAMYASVGKVAIAGVPMATSQAFFNMVFTSTTTRDFIFNILEKAELFAEWEPLISTGTQRNLNAEKIKNHIISIPAKDEMTAISSCFALLDRLFTLHQRLRDEEIQKKKALMQLLLTGIVRVKG